MLTSTELSTLSSLSVQILDLSRREEKRDVQGLLPAAPHIPTTAYDLRQSLTHGMQI